MSDIKDASKSKYVDSEVQFSKEKRKPNFSQYNKYRPDSTIDAEVIDRLEQIFKRYQPEETDAQDDVGREAQLEEGLVEFVETKKYGLQLIQLWNYYSNVNDHGKHTDAMLKLGKLLHFCNRFTRLHVSALELMKNHLLIAANLKVFYRDLSSMRPPTTNPALRLLTEIITFKQGELIDEFLRIFDMNLAVLPKLLIPSKNELNAGAKLNKRSIRYNFVAFYINLLDFSSAVTRKDILASEGANVRKLATNLFKYCSKYDAIDLVVKCLTVWDSKILSEPFLNKFKSIKLKFFNQWNIIALIPLYYITDESINEKFSEFLTKFLIDDKFGIYFRDDKVWFNESIHGFHESSDNGVSSQVIQVGGKKFRILNKFIYSILTEMKPWDNKAQLELVVKVLDKLPELVPLYVTYLASINNNYDPKMSFYWIGQTLLLQRIISLPIPDAILKLNSESTSTSLHPINGLVIESILPSCLNSVSLAKCIKSDSLLIRQLGIQLLTFSFRKLEKVMKVYELNGWNEDLVKLMVKFQSTIPEISILLSLFNDLEKMDKEHAATKDHKLLVLSLIMVVNFYLKHLSNNTIPAAALASLNNYFNKLISGSDFNGLDLLLLDNFFKLQDLTNNANEGGLVKMSQKWYSFTKDSNSLFTNLLKLCCYIKDSETIDSKIASLLSNLIDQTLMFHNHKQENPILVHQIFPLINSLKFVVKILESTVGIWNLLDQTVSRVVNPYKYIDLANQTYKKVSPFAVVLFEQFQYVDKALMDTALFWLVVFSKYLVIVGEPQEAILMLFDDYVSTEKSEVIKEFMDQNVDFHLALKKLLLSFALDGERVNKVLNNELSFFETVLNQDPLELFEIQEVIVTNFDLVGLLYKLSYFFNKSREGYSISSQAANFFSQKTENYLTFSNNHDAFLILQKYLFNNNSDLLFETITSILGTLSIESPSIELVSLIARCSVFIKENYKGVPWGKLWMVDDKTLVDYFEVVCEKFVSDLTFEVLARGITLKSVHLLHLLKFKNNDVIGLLLMFVKNGLICLNDHIDDVVSLVLPHKNLLVLFIGHDQVFAQHLMSRLDKTTNEVMFLTITSAPSKLIVDKSLVEYQTEKMMTILRQDGKLPGSITSTLNWFNNCFEYLNRPDKLFVFYLFFSGKQDVFTASALELVQKALLIDESLSIDVYLNKCFLYINKKFAETDKLTAGFEAFLKAFDFLISKFELAKVVNNNLINTQLEIVLSKGNWISKTMILEYVLSIISNYSKSQHRSSKTKLFEHHKCLQIFLNNQKLCLLSFENTPEIRKQKHLSSMIIYKLFSFDAAKNSTISLRENLLLSYNGSLSSYDLLLFEVMNQIEKNLTESWLNSYNVQWELDENTNSEDYQELLDQQRLIVKDNSQLVITLNRQYIKDTVDNFIIEKPGLMNELDQSLYSLFEKQELSVATANKRKFLYDPRFLFLSIINNPEFLSFDEENPTVPIFNLKSLVDSGILELLIVSLSSKDSALLTIAQTMLFNIAQLAQTNSSYRDKDLIKILILKILSSSTRDETSGDIRPVTDYPHCLLYQLSRLVPIITSPTHFLYEKAYKYLLGMATLSKNDLPLFKLITAADDPGVFYKELIWLLSTLVGGVKTAQDIQFLRNRNVFEWVFSLQSSPYLNYRIKKLIYDFLNKVQNIAEGADVLVTKYGLLPSLEIESLKAKQKTEQDKLCSSGKELLFNKQILLDIKEINIKNGLIIKNNKRLSDWTKDNTDQWIKRTCL